jgi:hypothetical protein
METWTCDQDSDPVLMVIAEPSESLAGRSNGCSPSCGRS